MPFPRPIRANPQIMVNASSRTPGDERDTTGGASAGVKHWPLTILPFTIDRSPLTINHYFKAPLINNSVMKKASNTNPLRNVQRNHPGKYRASKTEGINSASARYKLTPPPIKSGNNQ